MIQLVSIKIKTQRHIKAFLESNYGKPARFDMHSIFLNKLILCLTHDNIQHIDRVRDYQEEMIIKVPVDTYRRYGCYMNEKQMKFFNLFVDKHMKTILVTCANTYLDLVQDKSLTKAIQYSIDVLKISDKDWDVDSIKRFYHRYRVANKLPLLYNKHHKTYGEIAPLETA